MFQPIARFLAYNIECNVHHVTRIPCYILHLLCWFPIKTQHVQRDLRWWGLCFLFTILEGDIIALDLVINKGRAKGAQPPLSSLVENYAKTTTNFSFSFCNYNVRKVWGVKYNYGKAFSRPFQWYITSPQIPKILVGKTKNSMQLFSNYRASWSKKPRWGNDKGSFSQYFLGVHWRKVGHLLIIGDIY